MEFIMRVVTPRKMALGALGLGLLIYGKPYSSYPRRWYEHWRYPPQGVGAPASSDILAELESKDRRRIEGMHQRIMELLRKSDEEGYDVSPLRRRADDAAALNDARHRPEAMRLLSAIEMEIPRKKVQYIPMDSPSEPKAGTAASARHADAARKKRRQRRRG